MAGEAKAFGGEMALVWWFLGTKGYAGVDFSQARKKIVTLRLNTSPLALIIAQDSFLRQIRVLIVTAPR